MEYDNLEITSRDVCEVLRITRGRLSQLNRDGTGPAHEMVRAKDPASNSHRYRYRLKAVLDYMASRGASKTAIEAAHRKALTRYRLRLARAADRERIKAMSAIRSARRAREAAAVAGHKPSIAIFERGDF